jgi:hypothetical protein
MKCCGIFSKALYNAYYYTIGRCLEKKREDYYVDAQGIMTRLEIPQVDETLLMSSAPIACMVHTYWVPPKVEMDPLIRAHLANPSGAIFVDPQGKGHKSL